MTDMNDLLLEAEREQRHELEKQAKRATELRARLPQLVERAIMKERKRMVVRLYDETDLTQREIAAAVSDEDHDYSHAWVAKTIREAER